MDEDSVFWDDAYSVGFELIDGQHKELVRMTNELFEGCKKGGTAADLAFMATIRNAVEYAQTHFYTEEKYMKKVNYPDLAAHVKEHESFVATVVEAVKTFEEGKAEPLALARFLKHWLLNHIAVSDKKYGPYLKDL
ncbi:MAG: bacteriohemerythrin [Treponema sp.]|jgi:hemerythrin|nr:bacteriohemerythrin [Treponema sp.]